MTSKLQMEFRNDRAQETKRPQAPAAAFSQNPVFVFLDSSVLDPDSSIFRSQNFIKIQIFKLVPQKEKDLV